MSENVKSTNTNSKENAFWVSSGMNCIALKNTPGYQIVETSTKEEMWNLIYQLLETGYRVR